MKKTIGIIGGTGKQGSGLARYWARSGYSVRIGSRDTERGAEFARKFSASLGQTCKYYPALAKEAAAGR